MLSSPLLGPREKCITLLASRACDPFSCAREKYGYLTNFRWYTGVLIDLSHVEVRLAIFGPEDSVQ